ncbi:type VI secretion system PAAR protein [Vibrio aerogenes]|uniref:type VI secretion system PAAR protein n=1 Tax=Vibrio aerogenes TaxID=92172 RepID=UPI0021C28020|nr:type VI secretion system PAAR protein [Vibrio aerogenes]
MGNAVKVGNIGSDHDGFPPTPVTAGSPTVKFDGIPAARVGDPLAPHSKPKHPPHPRSISSGSSTVMIDGKPASMTGCSVSCGGTLIGGGTVNIGDQVDSPPPKKIVSSLVLFDRHISFSSPVKFRIFNEKKQLLTAGNSEKTYTGKLPATTKIKIHIS